MPILQTTCGKSAPVCARRCPGCLANCGVSGQRGFGLIEVLVAALVMAIGFLGIAALQASALRNSQGSLKRSQAVVLGYAILDAMRANSIEAGAGAYDMGMACQVPASPRTSQPARSTLAFSDRIAWLGQIRSGLGASGCGAIACTAVDGGGTDCRVTVRWDDSRGTGGRGQQRMTAVARL